MAEQLDGDLTFPAIQSSPTGVARTQDFTPSSRKCCCLQEQSHNALSSAEHLLPHACTPSQSPSHFLTLACTPPHSPAPLIDFEGGLSQSTSDIATAPRLSASLMDMPISPMHTARNVDELNQPSYQASATNDNFPLCMHFDPNLRRIGQRQPSSSPAIGYQYTEQMQNTSCAMSSSSGKLPVSSRKRRSTCMVNRAKRSRPFDSNRLPATNDNNLLLGASDSANTVTHGPMGPAVDVRDPHAAESFHTSAALSFVPTTSGRASPRAIERAVQRAFGHSTSLDTLLATLPPTVSTPKPICMRNDNLIKNRGKTTPSPSKRPQRKAVASRDAATASSSFVKKQHRENGSSRMSRSRHAQPPTSVLVMSVPPASTDSTGTSATPSTHVSTIPTGAINKDMPPTRLQQLTSRHTTWNAIPYNFHEIISDHRRGPRPPSPSARLRKVATVAAASTLQSVGGDIKPQAMRSREDYGGNTLRSSETHSAHVESKLLSRDVRPSGVKKIVKWDDCRDQHPRTLTDLALSAGANQEKLPTVCKASRPLDRHGNLLNARTPLSPIFPRITVTIRKIIYDDDV